MQGAKRSLRPALTEAPHPILEQSARPQLQQRCDFRTRLLLYIYIGGTDLGDIGQAKQAPLCLHSRQLHTNLAAGQLNVETFKNVLQQVRLNSYSVIANGCST